MNKRGRIQHRALLISDNHMFKLDPNKGYQRKKVPIPLQDVQGFGVSPHNDQGFIIHLRGNSDLTCYMLCPETENRVPELCAVLYQLCQRYGVATVLSYQKKFCPFCIFVINNMFL